MAGRSRTTTPSGAPYRWEKHEDPFKGRVVDNELDDCLQNGCRTQAEYDLFRATIQARIERAEAGQLGVPGDPGPDPVVTQPHLWEIRWSFSSDRELRSYHAEPVLHPPLLLGLKVHWKEFAPRVDETNALQNIQMAQAAERFRASAYHSPDEP